MKIDKDSLAEIISHYQYGKFDVFERGMKVIFNPLKKQMMLSPFYRARPTLGECEELIDTASIDIHKRHPKYHITKAYGKDRIFFTAKESGHWFLFVSEEDLMNGKGYTANPIEIADIVSKDPLVVDPSFKLADPLSELGYTPVELLNQGYLKCSFYSLMMIEGRGYPIGLTKKNEMVYLASHFSWPQNLIIGLQKPKEEIVKFDLNSIGLDDRLSYDSPCLGFIESMRNAKKTETYQELSPKDVFIH